MPPELKDTVGEIAYAGGYVVVINMGKCGIALNGDIIRCVGHNETVTGIIGNSDQEIFATVTTGVPATRMVGFGSNFPEGEDDLWKLIAYLRVNQQACG